MAVPVEALKPATAHMRPEGQAERALAVPDSRTRPTNDMIHPLHEPAEPI